jgi:arylsulfatase A-like enzyme
MRLVVVPLLLLLPVPPGSLQERGDRLRPNVVLIVADDLGYGDLGSYGAPDVKTPNLDRLAREGVRFTDFYANAPVCTPTRAALISGRYQQRVLLERPLSDTLKDHQDAGLPATGRSLPQLLRNAGYATALIGKWHLGWRPDFHPTRHGFQYFWGYLSGYVDWYTHVSSSGKPDLFENGTPVQHTGYLGHEVTRRATKFIADHAKDPFFVEVAYGEPHWPFQSPNQASTAVIRSDSMMQHPADPNPPSRKAYVEILESADAGVGQILDTLERSGLARNTLVIFVSDNGGEWLSRNAPLFHRKDSLWEGGIRVPALFRWPAVVPAGVTSRQVGITMDLTRTILGAADAQIPAEAKLEGIDLIPILRGSSGPVVRTLFWRNPVAGRHQRAVRSGDWKLLLDGGADMQFLFNVREDAGERNDLAAEHPGRVHTLKAAIEAWEKDVDQEAAAQSRRPAGVRQ